ncbi:MAG: response regulator transcription factor [Spirochaetales bacterium]|nr:response regulator transcription factor [Spirochaetales bacterium]
MAETEKILIIEDDHEIADVIRIHLEDAGYTTERCSDGSSGLEKALAGPYDCIILDLMLPGMDGLAVCRRIREKDPRTPILMLTAKSNEIDRVLGLEIGADDYLTKPFSVRELVARVRALLRRVRTDRETACEPDGNGIVRFGGFVCDFDKRKVTLNGKKIELTVKEFDLLALFIRNPGRAFSRSDLLRLVWGYQYKGYDHTVNSHINRLRAKIEKDPAHPDYLKTVWGIGYRFSEAGEIE